MTDEIDAIVAPVEAQARRPSRAEQRRLERLDCLPEASRSLRRELRKLRRLVDNLAEDAARAALAATLRSWGEVLKTALGRVPRGADRVRLEIPWQPGEWLDIELRRDLTPAANLDRIFRRARGLGRGQAIIDRRRAETLARVDLVQALVLRVDQQRAEPDLVTYETVGDLLDDIRRLGLRVQAARAVAPPASRADRKGHALPAGVERFVTDGGRVVWAGRNAVANDHVVTRLARGRDLWFHPRDVRGAHVVLQARGREDSPDETEIRACAMLAVHLTGMPRGERVDVHCVPCKWVRKPKRAAPGTVLIANGRVVQVVVDAEVIASFYDRRKRADVGG